MRRWNGWGDDSVEYPLPSAAGQFLETLVGTAAPPQDISRDQILKAVPRSRLPAHPLVTIDPLQRLLHTCGQSLPDWVAMHSGQINAFSDGVAYPADENEIRQLLQYAEQCEAALIP